MGWSTRKNLGTGGQCTGLSGSLAEFSESSASSGECWETSGSLGLTSVTGVPTCGVGEERGATSGGVGESGVKRE